MEECFVSRGESLSVPLRPSFGVVSANAECVNTVERENWFSNQKSLAHIHSLPIECGSRDVCVHTPHYGVAFACMLYALQFIYTIVLRVLLRTCGIFAKLFDRNSPRDAKPQHIYTLTECNSRARGSTCGAQHYLSVRVCFVFAPIERRAASESHFGLLTCEICFR